MYRTTREINTYTLPITCCSGRPLHCSPSGPLPLRLTPATPSYTVSAWSRPRCSMMVWLLRATIRSVGCLAYSHGLSSLWRATAQPKMTASAALRRWQSPRVSTDGDSILARNGGSRPVKQTTRSTRSNDRDHSCRTLQSYVPEPCAGMTRGAVLTYTQGVK